MAANPNNIDFRGIIAESFDGTYSTEYPNGDKPNNPAPTYTPFMNFNFNGTNGNSASQAEFSPEPDQSPNNSLTYSNDIAGPFGETINAKQSMVGQGNRSFGGTFLDGSALTIANNTDLWIRVFHYFPTAFCAGFDLGTGEGSDGSGNLKLIRWAFGATGDRMTAQLSNFANSACSTTMEQRFFTTEIANMTNDGEFNLPSPVTIPREQWVALQWRIRWSETNTGFVQAWMHDTYLGQISNIATKPIGDDILNDLTYGNYYNGAPHQAIDWYIQSIIATQQAPNTLDSGGRPYIAPTTQVGDFV